MRIQSTSGSGYTFGIYSNALKPLKTTTKRLKSLNIQRNLAATWALLLAFYSAVTGRGGFGGPWAVVLGGAILGSVRYFLTWASVEEHSTSFILMQALLPSIESLLLMWLVKIIPTTDLDDKKNTFILSYWFLFHLFYISWLLLSSIIPSPCNHHYAFLYLLYSPHCCCFCLSESL